MPKELRKRGKRHKKSSAEDQTHAQEHEVLDEGPSSESSSKQFNPDAPFGYVDPELKAYFKTVDDQLKEWQQNRNYAEGEEDVDPNENKRMFLMAALHEISGKERELATDPDCAAGLERMAYSMDDFVRRVFMDSLTGSYELLMKHRFASHVIQTLLAVAPDTIARESGGVIPKLEETTDKGELRTLTQLILDFSEEILPSLTGVIMDQFASHVLFQSDASHKSQTFVRSKRSVAWKAKQGPLKSIFGNELDHGQSQTEQEVRQPQRFTRSQGNSVAGRKQGRMPGVTKIEADQGLSDEPGSLMDQVLVGLISASHNDPSSVPEASDYIATLLRDPTSSHLLETLISHCPENVFGILWTTYFERSLRKLAMHPVANFVVAKALERANAEQLSYAVNELRDSLGKLRRITRIGILRALIERAAALNALEDEICEAICSAFQVGSEEDRKTFVLCALCLKSIPEYGAASREYTAPPNREVQDNSPEKHSQKSRSKVASNPLEPTTTGALLLQSLLRLTAPYNALVLDSIESLTSQELLALTHHPAASRVLDAIIDGPSIPPRSRRALLRAMEAQFVDIIDDRIGVRVGVRCWAVADPYLKEKFARALLPHTARLAGSPYARSFTRGLALSLLQRKPDEWRRQYATPSSGCAKSSPKKNNTKTKLQATTPSVVAVAPTNDNEHHNVDLEEGDTSPAERRRRRKKRKRSAAAVDEIDALFDDAIGRKVVRSALGSVPAPEPSVVKSVKKEADF
ncbi:armadillo-type protein [Russula aff. rugulosa BPL654]|nr:armadillo-type protein [Russula aff. rugulosa BPL654]